MHKWKVLIDWDSHRSTSEQMSLIESKRMTEVLPPSLLHNVKLIRLPLWTQPTCYKYLSKSYWEILHDRNETNTKVCIAQGEQKQCRVRTLPVNKRRESHHMHERKVYPDWDSQWSTSKQISLVESWHMTKVEFEGPRSHLRFCTMQSYQHPVVLPRIRQCGVPNLWFGEFQTLIPLVSSKLNCPKSVKFWLAPCIKSPSQPS